MRKLTWGVIVLTGAVTAPLTVAALEGVALSAAGAGNGQAATNLELGSRINTLENNLAGNAALIQHLTARVVTLESITGQITEPVAGSVSVTVKTPSGSLCGYAVWSGTGQYVPSSQAPCLDRPLLVQMSPGFYASQCPDGYTFAEVARETPPSDVHTSTCIKN